MGICYSDAKMLWQARLKGASFKNTVTIGHQSLYLHSSELKSFRHSFYKNSPASKIKPLENYKFGDYSDDFLRQFLAVDTLSIIDFSSYEGADIIHDLNQPIPENLIGTFDAVIDGGSLEHIFNFPVAITNLMKLLKIGGSIFITTPANNLCGHGFYQFSPELMFRVFTQENGFELQRIILFEAQFPSIELTSNCEEYEVIDPEEVRSRVGVISKGPVTMMVEAKKTDDVALFTKCPLQSDYVTLWDKVETQTSKTGVKEILKSGFSRLPFFLQARINGYRQKKLFSFSNKKFYKRL